MPAGQNCTITNATVDGNVKIGDRGSVTITDSLIDGNLQCEANSTGPTGGANNVKGNKEGRCAGL